MSINFIYSCNILTLSILISLLIIYTLQFSIYNKYSLEQCKLDYIIYPKNLNYNSSGYIPCNKFNTSFQTCISLYANIKNNKTKIIQNNISNIIDKSCTFRKSNCLNNFTYDIINSSIIKANEYKTLLSNNKTLNCWIDSEENNLYLYNQNYVDINIFIIISSLIFTFLIIMVIIKRCQNNYQYNLLN